MDYAAYTVEIDPLNKRMIVVGTPSALGHVYLIVCRWVVDRKFVGVNTNDRTCSSTFGELRPSLGRASRWAQTVSLVHLFNLEDIFALT